VPWTEDVSVNAGLLYGERHLVGCLGGSNIPGREIPRIVSLFESGQLKLHELVGRTFPFAEIGAAIANADRAEDAKTVVTIDSSF
jgi:S-(hydroxymethyl)glutathione dehydrogenase/alcohol dehydrogenase